MEEGSINVLVDAKEEYTKQLVSILKPCIYQGIKSIFLDAKDICNQDNTPENVLMVFQDLLSRIPKWSQDIINKEYQRIVDVSQCDYIEDLLKVVYVSHIKILTIVHSAQKNKKITLKVPSGSHFMHLCYIECAREFWKNPFLFSDRVTKYENQKNMRDSESMISECITETIRKQLPVRNILKEYLNEPDENVQEQDDTDPSEDIKNPINKKYLKRLETMVRKELLNMAKMDDKLDNKTDLNEEKQVVKETIKNLDEDMIRRIIKEEMDSRIKEGNLPTTVTPKKDVVNDVVEKIIEQVEEQVINTSDNNITTDSTKKTDNLETSITKEDTIVDAKLETIINVESKTDTKIDTKEEEQHQEINQKEEKNNEIQLKSPIIKIADIDEINLNLDELSVDDEKPVSVENETETKNETLITEPVKQEEDNIEEMISNSLDDLESFDLKSVNDTTENTDTKSIFFNNIVKSVFG